MSCGVGRRRGSDLVLLRLWCRLVAIALIRPLAWEPPYTVGVALKRQKKKQKQKKKTSSPEQGAPLRTKCLFCLEVNIQSAHKVFAALDWRQGSDNTKGLSRT